MQKSLGDDNDNKRVSRTRRIAGLFFLFRFRWQNFLACTRKRAASVYAFMTKHHENQPTSLTARNQQSFNFIAIVVAVAISTLTHTYNTIVKSNFFRTRRTERSSENKKK